MMQLDQRRTGRGAGFAAFVAAQELEHRTQPRYELALSSPACHDAAKAPDRGETHSQCGWSGSLYAIASSCARSRATRPVDAAGTTSVAADLEAISADRRRLVAPGRTHLHERIRPGCRRTVVESDLPASLETEVAEPDRSDDHASFLPR